MAMAMSTRSWTGGSWASRILRPSWSMSPMSPTPISVDRMWLICGSCWCPVRGMCGWCSDRAVHRLGQAAVPEPGAEELLGRSPRRSGAADFARAGPGATQPACPQPAAPTMLAQAAGGGPPPPTCAPRTPTDTRPRSARQSADPPTAPPWTPARTRSATHRRKVTRPSHRIPSGTLKALQACGTCQDRGLLSSGTRSSM